MSGIKIFISHQKQDSLIARKVKDHLENEHSIECYLDVVDPNLVKGEEIADYVRRELSKCSLLLAIVSDATKNSWWVPWEIGVATEKNYPLASFGMNIILPEFLMKWPYLKGTSDLDKYAASIKQIYNTKNILGVESYKSESVTASGNRTKDFYKTLRSKLGQ